MKDKKRLEYLDRLIEVMNSAMKVVTSSEEGTKEYNRALKLFNKNQALRNQLNVMGCPLDTMAVSNAVMAAERTLASIQGGLDEIEGESTPPEIDKESIAGRMVDQLEDGQKAVKSAYALAIKEYPHLANMPCVQALKGLEVTFVSVMKTLIKELVGLK